MTLKSELNSKKKFTTIGALTFSVLRYNFVPLIGDQKK